MGRSGLKLSSSSRRSRKNIHLLTAKQRAASARVIGTGEMAELTRSFDWAATPLGPVDKWSDTLVTTVNLLLASRHPMFLWWGSDLIQFYNDGYRPSIRADKHPSALGQRGVDCWPEIWPIIGPQIEAVTNQGQSSWNNNQLVPINRNGKLEEVFWTYGYSPVRDKDGSVQGTLVVCSETTEQVLSERRLRSLLAITVDPSPEEKISDSDPLLTTLHRMLSASLTGDPADLPFASLYLLNKGEVLHAVSTVPEIAVSRPEHWPLAKVVRSHAPVIVADLRARFGDLALAPWPEPLTQAYVLPLKLARSSIQAVLVFGLSPRLPFDHSYQTFLRLVGARIAGLLQSEVHRIEVAEAAERFSRLAEANPFGTVIGDLSGKLS